MNSEVNGADRDACEHCGAIGSIHAAGCPNAKAAAPDMAQLPVLAVRETKHWGAAPDGSEIVIIVGSVTKQTVKLHFTVDSLADFYVSVKQALGQARVNSRAAGNDIMAALPIEHGAVGHMSGVKGVILKLDPDSANESTYVLPHQLAIDVGKMLVSEGGKLQRRDQAIGAISMPPARKIIKPH